MTANKTARLKLMLPQGSDPFTPTDFVDTFNILDQYPGIKYVANYAGLPAGLTSANHGQIWAAMDTIATYGSPALWMWNRPSGASSGSWVRANSLGFLTDATLATAKATTSTSISSPIVDVAFNVTPPGGREVLLIGEAVELNNDADPWHTAAMGIRVGVGASLATPPLVKRANAVGSADGSGSAPVIAYIITRTTPNTTFTCQLVHAGNGHTGTSTMQPGARLMAIEI